jgi:hypothetical protein
VTAVVTHKYTVFVRHSCYQTSSKVLIFVNIPKLKFIKAPWITRIIFRFKTPLTPYLSGNPSNIPSIERLNEGINDGLNGLNEGIKETYRIVHSHPGINAPQIAVLAGKSLATIERHLSALRKKDLSAIKIQRKPEATTSSSRPYALFGLFCCFLYRICTTNHVTN